MAKKPITKISDTAHDLFFCLMAQAQPLHVGHAPTAVQYITYFEALKQAG